MEMKNKGGEPLDERIMTKWEGLAREDAEKYLLREMARINIEWRTVLELVGRMSIPTYKGVPVKFEPMGEKDGQ